MSFGWYHSTVTAVIDSCYNYNISLKVSNFLLPAKKQNPSNETTYLVKNFSLLLIFPSTKLWSSYITWLYITRTKLRTKWQTNPSLSHPIIIKLHFAATYTFSYFPISLTKSFFIDNNTTHRYPLPITHFSHTPLFWNFIVFTVEKHISISFFISHTKSPFLKSNITYNTNNLMYLLYLTFILSISHFHIFYKHISHKILIHTSHISLNFMSHKVYIYKIHVQQSIYI